MLMSKLVLVLSLLCLIILIAGSLIMPNDPIMWLAATSSGFIFLRLAVCAALIAFLVTNPPRSLLLRYVIGLFASCLVMGTMILTYENIMKWLDSLSLAAAGTALGIMALEINYETGAVKNRAFAGHGGHEFWRRALQQLKQLERQFKQPLTQ